MAACSEWHEALLDHAAGGEAVNGWVEHMSQCPECARALDALRDRTGQLDRSLGALFRGQEPRPGFDQRVVAAARKTRPAPRYGLWVGAAAACAVLLLAFTLLPGRYGGRVGETPLDSAVAIANWRSPTEFLLAPPLNGTTLETPRFGPFRLGPTPPNGPMGDDDETR
jgi:hypothetical protein